MKKLITCTLLALSIQSSAEIEKFDVDNEAKEHVETVCFALASVNLDIDDLEHVIDKSPSIIGMVDNSDRSIGVFYKRKKELVFTCLFRNDNGNIQLGMFGKKHNMTGVKKLY